MLHKSMSPLPLSTVLNIDNILTNINGEANRKSSFYSIQ